MSVVAQPPHIAQISPASEAGCSSSVVCRPQHAAARLFRSQRVHKPADSCRACNARACARALPPATGDGRQVRLATLPACLLLSTFFTCVTALPSRPHCTGSCSPSGSHRHGHSRRCGSGSGSRRRACAEQRRPAPQWMWRWLASCWMGRPWCWTSGMVHKVYFTGCEDALGDRAGG